MPDKKEQLVKIGETADKVQVLNQQTGEVQEYPKAKIQENQSGKRLLME